jgi:hypothetical protein
MWRTEGIPLTDEQVQEHIRLLYEETGETATPDDIRAAVEAEDELWTNRTYQCAVFHLDPVAGPFGPLHLSIKRRDKKVIHDWRDLQNIKNDVAGRQREAAELYPAENRLVDTANQYHLWVLPHGGSFPFGYNNGRLVTNETGASGAVQRPRA